MPAIITHHLFGEDAANRLPVGLVEGQEELLAFLLGNQGPDPFRACFSTLPQTAAECHRLAHELRHHQLAQTLLALREAVSHLPEEDKRVGRAFALGFAAHLALDCPGDRFVLAQRDALCSVSQELQGREGEVRALIESDLDSWMLWAQRGQTVADCPTSSNLARTERVTRVAGALFSQVAWQVFDMEVGADAYASSVDDYELIYSLIDSGSPTRTAALARIEGLLSGRRYLQARVHHLQTDDNCAAANLERRPWADGSTGKTRTDSFADIYFDALDAWPPIAEAFVRGDEKRLRAMAGTCN